MRNEELEEYLKTIPEIIYAKVEGDGHHYHLTIVSSAFEGKRTVSRQQWVYGKMKEKILSGAVHAVNMDTFTPAEWENNHG